MLNSDKLHSTSALHWVAHFKTTMDKTVDSFHDTWLEKWSSSYVDVRIHAKNFVNPIEVNYYLCGWHCQYICGKAEFNITSEFQCRCFKRSMEGLLIANGVVKVCRTEIFSLTNIFPTMATPNYSDNEYLFDDFDEGDINDCHDGANEITESD